MVTQKQILEYINSYNYYPSKFNDLKIKFDINNNDDFGKLLDELVYSGKIYKSRNGLYISTESERYVFGKFSLMPKGFGFLRTGSEKFNDIFIGPNDTNFASNDDIVLVEITNRPHNLSVEGKIVEILERANSSVVGRIQKNRGVVFLVPLDKHIGFDVYITNKKMPKIKDGLVAVAKITKWPDKLKGAAGEITEVLGDFNQKGVDVLSVIKSRGIRCEFSNSCLNEASVVSKKPIDLCGRTDLRDLLTITIDGQDAKDLDDAVSLEKINDTYSLWVHIADVSEYVTHNSKLDREAFKRSTSVYFADRVVPMLPEKISNGSCSLNPLTEKLALSVNMEIDLNGNVKKYDIKKSVIVSDFRMTYDDVHSILLGDETLCEKYSKITAMLNNMKELMLILNKKRTKRGSVDFEIPEPKFIFNPDGTVKDIIKRQITDANKIIEEFMLICNETVAEHMHWNNLPCVYRIHEKPSEEKVEAFKKLLKPLGYTMKNSKDLYPGMFSDLLKKIKDTPEEKTLTTMMLRSFMKAKYSNVNEGHFGLSSNYYCHFTSPIRRYPDLVVHRILKDSLNSYIEGDKINTYNSFVEKASIQSSEKEISAMEAERIVDDIKKAEFMSNYIGEEFLGVVSSVTSFGIFVELDNTCEGLIRYKDIDFDYFEFDSENMKAIGINSGKCYKIGDAVKINVANAIPETGEIDFIFA